MTRWVDEDKAVDVVHLNFSKVSDTVSYNILLSKPRHNGLAKETVRWGENWLKDRDEKVVCREAEISLGTREGCRDNVFKIWLSFSLL